MYFDPTLVSTIQADASQADLGACLFQKDRPIAYTSSSLSPSEYNYAQIEKELLAIVFECSKFIQYIYEFHIKIQQAPWVNNAETSIQSISMAATNAPQIAEIQCGSSLHKR